MKKIILLMTGIVLLHTVFAGARQTALFNETGIHNAKKHVVRIMTYNVHHCNPPSIPGKIDVEAIAKVIREANPDLVALQEIDVFTNRSGKALHEARELGRLTGMYSFFARAIDFQGGEYGIAILSKFPLLDSAVYALQMKEGSGGEARAMATVTVDLRNGKKLLFACSHLDLKAENRSLQVRQIRSLLADRSEAIILAADFNDTPGGDAINYMDGFMKRSCTENCPNTFPQIDPNKVIDMIFTSSRFKVKSHTAINESYASDHLPVLTELKY